VETIFLYQLHWPDPEVPFADSVGTLAELQREGKIRHIGLSNVTPAQLTEGQAIARIESVQNRCSPTAPEDFSNGLLELCDEQQITYIPYSPVGGGSGHKRMAANGTLQKLARTHGVSTYQIVLAWLLGKSLRVIPIPGGSRVASVRDSAAASTLRLPPEDAARIDRLR
jgi:aryl-alcohol dehydrogenase-like predicted oxidoreductase